MRASGYATALAARDAGVAAVDLFTVCKPQAARYTSPWGERECWRGCKGQVVIAQGKFGTVNDVCDGFPHNVLIKYDDGTWSPWTSPGSNPRARSGVGLIRLLQFDEQVVRSARYQSQGSESTSAGPSLDPPVVMGTLVRVSEDVEASGAAGEARVTAPETLAELSKAGDDIVHEVAAQLSIEPATRLSRSQAAELMHDEMYANWKRSDTDFI